jgi:RimJ/RimL family protein N-acetyltransferase
MVDRPMIDSLRTARLILRRWRASDREAFSAINADAETMRYLGGPIDRAASDLLFDQLSAGFGEDGVTLWAVDVIDPTQPIDGARFIGFAGLWRTTFAAHFTPCVEVAWRLSRASWGHGYATEAAREACAIGFTHARLSEIVAHTVPANVRSQRVMQKLGMTREPADDFDHPRLAQGNPLRRHVLYRLRP